MHDLLGREGREKYGTTRIQKAGEKTKNEGEN